VPDLEPLCRGCPDRVTKSRDLLGEATEVWPSDRDRVCGRSDNHTRASASGPAAGLVGNDSDLSKEVPWPEGRDPLPSPLNVCSSVRDGVEVERELAFIDDDVPDGEMDRARNRGHSRDIARRETGEDRNRSDIRSFHQILLKRPRRQQPNPFTFLMLVARASALEAMTTEQREKAAQAAARFVPAGTPEQAELARRIDVRSDLAKIHSTRK